MLIEIYSDFACPFCYIGKTNLEHALKEFAHKDTVKIVYKSFQLNPNAPKQTDKSAYELFAQSHGVKLDDAKARFNQIENHAKASGLEFNYEIMKMTNTIDAHRLYKYAEGLSKDKELMTLLLEGYFNKGLDLSNKADLLSITNSIGLNSNEVTKILESNDYLDDVKQDFQEAKDLGIGSVPFFVIDRKYGISGGQPKEYFLGALQQIHEESQIEETENLSCGIDGC